MKRKHLLFWGVIGGAGLMIGPQAVRAAVPINLACSTPGSQGASAKRVEKPSTVTAVKTGSAPDLSADVTLDISASGAVSIFGVPVCTTFPGKVYVARDGRASIQPTAQDANGREYALSTPPVPLAPTPAGK